jgi:hypothetical protein
MDLVTRARNVVGNSEIAWNDVHQEVVATLQRIRILLLILDTLTETYNTSN